MQDLSNLEHYFWFRKSVTNVAKTKKNIYTTLSPFFFSKYPSYICTYLGKKFKIAVWDFLWVVENNIVPRKKKH